MDAAEEIDRERSALAMADADIEQGAARIARQQEIVDELRLKGRDAREAGRLLDLLAETLAQWRSHRTLIVQRIAYLETKLAEPRQDDAS